MKDYYATLRLQQGRLKAAMQEAGIETAAELSRQSGATQGEIGDLLNFRKSPRTKSGDWRAATRAICKALGATPSDVFPEHLDHEIPTNQIASYVEHAQLTGNTTLQIGPGDRLEQAELEQTLDEVLGTLTPRERHVLKARFWENRELQDIAEEHGVTKSAIYLEEKKALRKLRRPKSIGRLEDVCSLGHKWHRQYEHKMT